ncbi:carotenoid oxygenase family protein [Synechococcus sp. PCC 7336]|uniref:carotenoid oxygenase family protein n=1 Tax=Synechococcus sp. PCC 7336 TaxID=195250 RepID=UPI000346CF03|nr:carotenoid oxygenase family protein [Synechococcus sp. PCC 7336]
MIAVNPVATPAYTTENWRKGYASLKQERDYWIDDIDGSLPTELVGTLFRNGPGGLDISGQDYGHPFDGDGAICAITFCGDKAHFRNRYVRTPEFLAEQQAGRILYRSVFGTQRAGGFWNNWFDFNFKNPANTNVVYQGGKLLALWEADVPYRLDPATLETLGKEDFNGVLSKGQAFTAHPRIDPETGDLIAFGVDPGPTSTLYFYRVDPDGKLAEVTSHKIPGFCFLHDFALTPNYRIFFQNPVSFNPIPVALGLRPPAACIELDPKANTRIIAFDRQGKPRTFTTDPGFIFHHANAYEEGDRIIVDSLCYDDYMSLEPGSDYREVVFEEIPYARLVRYELDLQAGTASHEAIVDRPCEFPALNPACVGRKQRYTYVGTTHAAGPNAPLQAVMKVDMETRSQQIHSFAPRGYLGGDPVFVPRLGGETEDDGWIVVLVFDAVKERSDVVILDARNLEGKPVAVLHLKHHIPYGLHGNFTPEVFVR